MTEGRRSSLQKKYDKALSRNKGESVEGLRLLKEIVQSCVELNDDKSAYAYQQKVCQACERVYGPESFEMEKAQLYCRELMICAAPLKDRVKLCKEYWEDAKKDYGENSYVVRILVPLYVKCCNDAGEIEELRLVCSEVISIFGKNDDKESRQTVALCSWFDIFFGEKRGDIKQIEAACHTAGLLFGKDSAYELFLRGEIGMMYRKDKEFDKAAGIDRALFRLSEARHGKYALETIELQKNYVSDLIFAGHLRRALAEARRLERAVAACPDRNQCPDVYECFAFIYMKSGKEKLAGKYARMSLCYNERNSGSDAKAALKASYVLAVKALMFSRNADDTFRSAFRSMFDYMAKKEQWLYNIYLLSSDICRETYFDIQNLGEYDVCLGAALSNPGGLEAGGMLSSLWEVACNYKTLMGDCELLHSAIRKKEGVAEEIPALKAVMQSGDKRLVIEAERCLLELSRAADFPGYVNSVNVRDIQGLLQEDEMLLDYYCVHFSDLEVYAAMVVTKHFLKLVQLGAIGMVNGLMEQITSAICRGSTRGASGENDSETDESGRQMEELIAKLSDCLVPEVVIPPRVILCPDGELYRFAFDVLLEDTEIVYVTNPKDIVRRRAGICGGKQPVRTVNVFADPLFSLAEEQLHDTDGEAQERSGRLIGLPGTRIEAAIIEKIYGSRVRSFTRMDANEQMFFQNCIADVLHIGTHAVSGNGGRIYLAGANDTRETALSPVSGKGYITSTEIAGLDMKHTRLAVLSACQTGIGEYRDYFGVRGLRRSFQIAGAEFVMAAFWNISDIATAVFMYEFYMEYSRCNDCTAAMYRAKNYMRCATVRDLREQIYPVMSDILLQSKSLEAYKEFRDVIKYGSDEETPFASPYYWAAFSIYN